MPVLRRVLLAAVAAAILLWAAAPLARAVLLVRHGPAVAPIATPGVRTEEVSFAATDGVRLRGTLLTQGGAAPVVIMVHGFKTTRWEMLGRALPLHDAGYAVLLYDSRGCGESEGVFGAGATEERDIRGAVDFARSRGATRIAVLGISLGAGTALLAAARDARIGAVVADSAWPDARFQIDRMGSIAVGPVVVPLLPYEAPLVDALVGGSLEAARPIDDVARIAPRAVLLIHAADDANATTPPAEARALFAAAREPKELWMLPYGGHTGAFSVDAREYVRRVTAFLERALR